MFIAIVDFTTTAADQPAALAQLDAEREEVRAMPGNIAYRVYASREADPGITIVHEWEDETSFARYTESDAFARSGAVLRPMMTSTPLSRRFRCELAETVR
jgi:quinol monooxygenase YgiN